MRPSSFKALSKLRERLSSPLTAAHRVAAASSAPTLPLALRSAVRARRFSAAAEAPSAAADDDALSSSSSSASSSHVSVGRWSSVLDPHNPPKLTLQHYSLLDNVIKKRRSAGAVDESGSPTAPAVRSPSASAAAAMHPTVLNPALDAAIAKLDALLASAASEDPEVREQLTQLRKQYRVAANPLASPPADGEGDGVTASSDPDLPAAHVTGGKLRCRFCRLRRRADQYPAYSLAYTNVALLHQFINIRGMIYPRRLTGNCRRHQRRLSEAVKRARVMGLLAYTSNWKLPQGWQPVEGETGYGALGQIVPEDAALGIMGEYMGEGEELSELDAADEDDRLQPSIDTEGYADFEDEPYSSRRRR